VVLIWGLLPAAADGGGGGARRMMAALSLHTDLVCSECFHDKCFIIADLNMATSINMVVLHNNGASSSLCRTK